MVYTLPQRGQPNASLGNILGQGISQGFLSSAQPAIQQEYQKGQLQKQLIQAQNVLSDPSSSEQQKQVGLYQALSGRPDIAKQIYDQYLMKNELSSKQQAQSSQLNQNKQIISDLEVRRNLPPGSLSAYENNPKMAEQVSRKSKDPKKTQSSQPIDPDQLRRIQEVRSSPSFKDMDDLEQFEAFIDAGVSKENAEAYAKIKGQKLERRGKEFENSYKAQEGFINETTDKYKAFETEMKPRLMQMQHMDPEKIIGPTASVFLDHLGIPLGALEDPSSELYQKLSQDLLKGLPDTYGNRILKVEVDNFLKTIPTLMNSVEGRRMISSNMLKLGEMKEVYYNEMRKQQKDYLDTNNPIPRDFQQRIFDQVKPQIDRINNDFVKMSEVTSVPKDTIPFFNPMGEIEFIPIIHADWASKNGGRRIW